jgi:hypothetical protein
MRVDKGGLTGMENFDRGVDALRAVGPRSCADKQVGGDDALRRRAAAQGGGLAGANRSRARVHNAARGLH